MKPDQRILFGAVILAMGAVQAQADPLPRGAAAASRSEVGGAYFDRTDRWEDNCNGGIYYGANGEARGWCADNPEALGAGRWGVTEDGRLCYRLDWYSRNAGQVQKERGDRTCIAHVTDSRGRLWRQWKGDSEWWPAGNETGLAKGYSFKDGVQRARAALGF